MGVKIDINSGGVRFAKSNPLRFVRTDTRSGYTQNKDEYLLHELTYPYFDYKPYYQKFDLTLNTPILLQVATLYPINSVKLYDWEDTLISTLTGDLSLENTVETEDYSYVYYYNLEVDISGLDGYYYLIYTINTTQTYKCEYFNVDSFSDTDGLVIKYYNLQTSKYDDGIYYNGSMEFSFWLEGRIYDSEFGQDKTMFNSFNNEPEILKGTPTRGDLLEYGLTTWYMSEKLNLAFQHDYFSVNEIQYRGEDVLTDEHIKQNIIGSTMHKGSVIIRPKYYESYIPIVEKEAETQNNVLYGTTDADYVKWSDSDTDRLIYADE